MKKQTEKTTKKTTKKTSKKALVIEKPKKTRYEELVESGVIGPDASVDDGATMVGVADTYGPPEEKIPDGHYRLNDGTVLPIPEDEDQRDYPATKENKPSPELVEAIQERVATINHADGLCTFAFRLTPDERDEIHRAAGKGGASKFVKAVALAVARADGQAIQEHIDRILSAINGRIVSEQQAR